jgi:hypothetical protein
MFPHPFLLLYLLIPSTASLLPVFWSFNTSVSLLTFQIISVLGVVLTLPTSMQFIQWSQHLESVRQWFVWTRGKCDFIVNIEKKKT